MRLPLLKYRTKKSEATPPRKTWLDVDGFDLPVTIAENPRSRRLTLRIQPGGEELRHVGSTANTFSRG